ncbi:MAG: glucose-1-phosphate adenylyltransferase [Clostridia bacterium]|nr:glucose-1-phosphate adenylyltransferase [Clostridia bacterium]
MIKKKKCVAMLLAGGQGSRLYSLTTSVAKPAVRFGSKYRIIDFTLSNCINSGIDTVGVLTQYQPLELNDYIGNGEPWDLDRTNGGVHILPPYQDTKGAAWYKGTANAIYQNIAFMKRYNPEYILVLSGDHIYKMDYSKMIDAHIKNGADCTIAVLNVPIEEASRFGIMNTDKNNRIVEFEEKPAKPKSTKASMGVYVFSADKLFSYLEADEADPNSSNDFGKNIIPNMLNDNCVMYAYEFSGYWKDVGTISSLWEANMDLLGDNPSLDLNSPDNRVYYRHFPKNPHYIGNDAKIKNSLIAEGCEINGTVENSVLFDSITVEKGAVIRNSVIMSGATVRSDANINYSIIAENADVKSGAKIGDENGKGGITVVANDITVGENQTVAGGEMIDKNLQ